jgi:exosortase H (IPTLxxWG-CTERM-specific)
VTRKRLAFLAKFFVLLAAFYVVISQRWVDAHVIDPFTRGVGSAAASVLRLAGDPVERRGTLLASRSFAVEIKNGCNGIEAMLVLVAAILAFPAGAASRAAAIAAGIAIIQLLNLLRVVVLFVVGRDYPSLFETFHVIVGQSVIFLVSIGLFALWSSRFADLTPRQSGA